MNPIAIGDQLRLARESRGLSIDFIADETNIAKRYLTAMENEDFSVFPGEPYAIGFLKNYSDYLGLDSAAILHAFKGIRIQEQATPIAELLPPPKKQVWPFLVLGLLMFAAFLSLFVYKFINKKPNASKQNSLKTDAVQYSLDSGSLEKRFYEGDSILVPFGNSKHKLTISKIDERIAIENPVGTTQYMLGEEGIIDLDKDNQPELHVFVIDFQKNNPDKGAVIRFRPMGELQLLLGSPAEPQDTVLPEAAAKDSLDGAPAAKTADRPSTQETVVFSGKRSPYPFVLNVTFRNYAMFRHELDRKDRDERYYHKGDQINVTANSSAKLWTSNAAACKLVIQASGGQSADVDLGVPGEVAVKHIYWAQADDGTWYLGVYNVN